MIFVGLMFVTGHASLCGMDSLVREQDRKKRTLEDDVVIQHEESQKKRKAQEKSQEAPPKKKARVSCLSMFEGTLEDIQSMSYEELFQSDQHGWSVACGILFSGKIELISSIEGYFQKAINDEKLRKGYKLLHVVVMKGLVSYIDMLVGFGASVDTRIEGVTPLHFAVWKDQVECIEKLGQLGANLAARTGGKDDYTPLQLAVKLGRVKCIETLAHVGVNLDTRGRNGYTLLYEAVELGQVGCVEQLVRLGANIDNRTESHSLTPLHHAASKGQVDCVEMLVKLGADLEAQDIYRRTPLHRAAIFGHVACIEMLVDLGAKVDAQNKHGSTPLLAAVLADQVDSVKALACLGASLVVRNIQGQSPLYTSLQKNNNYMTTTLLALLSQYSAHERSQGIVKVQIQDEELDVPREFIEAFNVGKDQSQDVASETLYLPETVTKEQFQLVSRSKMVLCHVSLIEQFLNEKEKEDFRTFDFYADRVTDAENLYVDCTLDQVKKLYAAAHYLSNNLLEEVAESLFLQQVEQLIDEHMQGIPMPSRAACYAQLADRFSEQSNADEIENEEEASLEYR